MAPGRARGQSASGERTRGSDVASALSRRRAASPVATVALREMKRVRPVYRLLRSSPAPSQLAPTCFLPFQASAGPPMRRPRFREPSSLKSRTRLAHFRFVWKRMPRRAVRRTCSKQSRLPGAFHRVAVGGRRAGIPSDIAGLDRSERCAGERESTQSAFNRRLLIHRERGHCFYGPYSNRLRA